MEKKKNRENWLFLLLAFNWCVQIKRKYCPPSKAIPGVFKGRLLWMVIFIFLMEFYFSFGLQNGVVSLAVWRQHAHWCQSTWLTLDLLICEPWMQTLGAVDRVSLVPSQVVTVHRTVGRRRQTVLEGTGNDSEFCHFARICTFFYLKCRKCYRICLGVKKILYFFTWLRHMQCERRSDIRPWYLFLINF